MNRQQQQQRQQQLVLPDPADLGAILTRGVTALARRHKVITGTYLFGFVMLLVAGTGTKLTLDQQRTYNSIMDTIDLEAEFHASQVAAQTYQAYHQTKGWFFTCDSLCQRNKQRYQLAQRNLQQIRNEGNARMSDAKAVAGLFSEVGVGEVKDSFWSYFQQGKQFAKRQSMWDAMFMGIRHMGRDESMANYALKVLFQVLLNFSMGLIIALGMFIIGLWSIVREYQPNPIVALVFFLCAASAAFTFVISYLLAIFGATAGGLYGMAKLAETQQRARIQQQQQQQRMGPVPGQRPHYE